MTSDIGDVQLFRANNGAIRFHVRSISGLAQLALCANTQPYRELFIVTVGYICRIVDGVDRDVNLDGNALPTDFIDISRQLQEFWLSWFNHEVRLGMGASPTPIISYKYDERTNLIGYVKFEKTVSSNHVIDWVYESPPIVPKPIEYKYLNGGELRWVSLTDYVLPPDALIGGFEREPIYVARAGHNGSQCPGKYVPSKRLAYIAWGGREHVKTNFQILCGYNAAWVETRANKIPPNAFIGGVSEVRGEPLYIGRAVVEGRLICGKIHVIYHTCYLPYNGKEVEVYSYDILVRPDATVRSVCSDVECEI